MKSLNRFALNLILGLALPGFLMGLGSVEKTPLERYGRLHVEDLQLVSETGAPVQLRGVSSHKISGSDWMFGPDQLKELRSDWKADVVRLAMFTAPQQQGYILYPGVKKSIDQIILDTENEGLYCIVDWHITNNDGDPTLYQKEAVAFFRELAAQYKDKKHLLFEICNEPNGAGVTWDEKVRPYAVAILAAIRESDPSRIVLIGTPTWSQDIDIAAANPLPDPQVMYVFHWYAGSHGQKLRDKVDVARRTVPVFCSEWGSTLDTGDGDPFPVETAAWLKFLDDRGISSCNWSLSTVREGSAAVLPSYEGEGLMKDALSPSGEILYNYLRNRHP